MRDKKLYLSPIVKDLILTHHELADGTGGPLGKNQNQLQEYQMMLPLADYLEDLRTSAPTDVENTFIDTLKYIIDQETNHKKFGRLGPAFNTSLIQQIKGYFNIE
jgi:HD-GYP domain-containing protein (c-di-GMP phosphodiesterase class II)